MATKAPLRPGRRALLLALLIALLTPVLVATGTEPALAVTGNIRAPFNIGETWNICQGYGGSTSHTGTSFYGLDLTGMGCDNSAAGRQVIAPISGTLAYTYQAAYGNLCINIAGGGSYTLTHIDSTVTGSVTAGQVVGTVAAANQRGNNGIAHLHFQIWSSSGCYNSNVMPFDTAHGVRICGAPDLTPGTTGGRGTWSGTSFTGATCGSAAWPGVGASSTSLGGDTLTAGQQLNTNQYIESADARFVLLLQSDGNLVLYNGSAIWSSGTANATRLVMQTDGNLVLYNVNTPVWFTATGGTGAAHLVLQNDGNLVTYNNSSGSPTWWTGTGGHTATTAYGTDTLTGGNQLSSSGQQYLRSSDNRYGLLLQSDGNLVLYGPGYHILWNSGTNNATRLVMQTDGNLVLYNVNTPVWFTATGGTGAAHLVLQNDGNLVAYKDGTSTVLWQSGTSGLV